MTPNTGAKPQKKNGQFYDEAQSVDVTLVDATGKVLARIEVKTFNITNLDEHADYLQKLENQLIRYIKLTDESKGEKFFYAVPDAPTQQKLMEALSKKGQRALTKWKNEFPTEFSDAQFIRKS